MGTFPSASGLLTNRPLAANFDSSGTIQFPYSDGLYLRYQHGYDALEILEYMVESNKSNQINLSRLVRSRITGPGPSSASLSSRL